MPVWYNGFVFFGEGHLRHVIREFVARHHEGHPYQGLGNEPLTRVEPWRGEQTVRQGRLSGLLKSYRRGGTADRGVRRAVIAATISTTPPSSWLAD